MQASFPCPNNCSLNGACKNSSCVCEPGWVGPDCGVATGDQGTCAGNCSGHGSCVTGACACDIGWEGSTCSLVSLASTRLACSANCSGGGVILPNGTCLCYDDGEPSAAPHCPLNCSGRGICAGGSCICDRGFSRVDCATAEPLLDCPGNCTSRGTCVNGTCICDFGWAGDDCAFRKQPENVEFCPSNCSSYGVCMNGTCICDGGHQGVDCGLAAPSAFSSWCILNCSGHGACINRTCDCDLGFSGPWCQVHGRLGGGALIVSNSTDKSCPRGCAGHGTCLRGVCVCDPLYSGVACDQVLISALTSCPGAHADCSGHGSCVNGTCICDALWESADCSVAVTCPKGSGSSQNATCSGQGPCYNGTCVCKEGTAPGCAAHACPIDCAHHGACVNGTCLCDPGWTGPTCTTMDCPGGCKGRGSCTVYNKAAVPSCACDAGWTGADCSVRLCPTLVEGSSCSGHGACTQNGTCICYQGWAGSDCSTLVDCSSRGKRKCGFCVCVDGFTGDNCEVDICQDSRIYSSKNPTDYTRARVCSDHGQCTTSKGCVCNPGWAGPKCANASKCPGNCSGHGVCAGSRDNLGICACASYNFSEIPFNTPRFSGDDCSVEHCPGWINGKECSGRGTCQRSGSALVCSCFLNPADNTRYSGPGCNRPPRFFFQNLAPAVGPLEGGTVVTINGPGIELLLVQYPRNVFCSFGGIAASAAYLGTLPDIIICVSPPTSFIGTVAVTLVGNGNQTLLDSNTRLPAISNQLQFLYFAQTQIIGINPSFAPLRPTGPRRWIGPWDAYGPNKDGSNVITVTGTYFPPGGSYTCKFGDCDNVQAATRIDAVTLACTMPIMATASQMNIYVSSNAQQYSNTGGKASAFTVWAITAISPVCGDILGSTLVTVFGQNLIDSVATRDASRFYCRFGRPTSTGQVMIPNSLSKKVFAFYSKASVSATVPGALVCSAPNWPVEEDDFALSLDALCGIGDCNPLQTDGYYIGQWDAVDSIPSSASYVLGPGNIPAGVKFSTFYHPLVSLRSDLNSGLSVISPSIGPATGGTIVTITGYGFDYARYGPLTPNPQFASWTPGQLSFDDGTPKCQVLGLPAYSVSNSEYRSSPAGCSFGTDFSTDIEFVSDGVLVCVSPPVSEPVSSVRDVILEVALDGQSFTSNGFIFKYIAPVFLNRVIPSVGVTTGGTKITIEGQNLIESSQSSIGGSAKVMQCVFMLSNGSKTKTPAESLGGCADITAKSCTAVSCLTPFVEREQKLLLDISLSGQIQDSQLTGDPLIFFMYTNPTILDINPSIGPGDSLDDADRIVNLLLDIDDYALQVLSLSPQSTQCRFGTIPVPGTLQMLTGGKRMLCVPPKMISPLSVVLQVTFNGVDWSDSPSNYTYFVMTGPLLPSSGPISGGTVVSFGSILQGSLHISSIEVRFGALPSFTFANISSRTFLSPGSDVAYLAPIYLRVYTIESASNWIYFGFSFLYYDVRQAFSGLMPCLPLSDCSQLIVRKDGKPYPISILVNTARINPSFALISQFAVKCGFWVENKLLAGPAIESCGSFVQDITENITVIRCSSPPLSSLDPDKSYFMRISLNGQNYDNQVFELLYIQPPIVNSIVPSVGLKSGGMKIYLSISFPKEHNNFSLPSLFSCLFFNNISKSMHFTSVEELVCSMSNTSCVASCTTPEILNSMYCPKFDVYFSMNRRDPCFSDDCQLVCSGSICSCSGVNSSVTSYDTNTLGWCSHCSGSNSCNGACYFAGSKFQFYDSPAFTGLSPRSIGGLAMRRMNQTVPITIFGRFPTCLSSNDVKIRVTFLDGNKKTMYETGRVILNLDRVIFQIPIPCADISSNVDCQGENGLDLTFRQQENVMIVQFQLSLNGGAQYSTPDSLLTLRVYKQDAVCPSDGCGHGTCLTLLPTSSTTVTNTCVCGYWGQIDSGTLPICSVGNDLSSTCKCISDDTLSPRALCPSTCIPPKNTSSLGAPDGWFCSRQPAPLPSTTYLTYGPEHWPDGYRRFSVDCSASPAVTAINPSVGFIEGGSKVRVALNVLGFADDPSSVLAILKFSSCFFDGVRSVSSVLNSSSLLVGEIVLFCTTPKYSKLDRRNVSMEVSFQNLAGVASPLAFPVMPWISSAFLFVFQPVVANIALIECASKPCSQLNGLLSAPTCRNRCLGVADMFVLVEGYDFENVSELVCCYTQGFDCPAYIGTNLIVQNNQSLSAYVL